MFIYPALIVSNAGGMSTKRDCSHTSYTIAGEYGSNLNQIWCVNMREIYGLWGHRGFSLLLTSKYIISPPVIG